jgi:hypothetical protein
MTHKIDTDGRDVGLGVGVIGKSQKQARLSNTGISDEEELEEIVVSEKAVHVRKMSSRIASRHLKRNQSQAGAPAMKGKGLWSGSQHGRWFIERRLSQRRREEVWRTTRGSSWRVCSRYRGKARFVFWTTKKGARSEMSEAEGDEG